MTDGGGSVRFDRVVSRPHFSIRHLAADRIDFAPHAHAVCTVGTVLAGSVEATVGGVAARVAAGQSVLIAVGEQHAATGSACQLLSVGISPLVLDELINAFGWSHPQAYPVFAASVVTDPTLSLLACQIADELEQGHPGFDIMIDALVHQMAVRLLRSHLRVRRIATLEHTRVGPIDRRLRRAVELMAGSLEQDLSLGNLADAVSLSPSHFAHLFREVMRTTPHGYLSNLRIERARSLLIETDHSITEIARRVGFRSPSHFATAFRHTVGASPRSFRASALANRPLTEP